MNKQDMMKIQTCALKVHIHCEGCAQKIKKKLRKVEGVYKVNIDAEQGKVTVSGNVDPLLLINKLEKGGKHAELWGPQKGGFPIMNNNQMKNMQFENLKDVKGQKGGGQIPKQIQMQMQMQQMMNQKKGGGEEKFMGKDQKSVKFKLPEEFDDEFDEDDDDFDDEFDEDDDEFDEEPVKGNNKGGHGAPAKKAAANGGGKEFKDGGKGKKGGGGIDLFFKGILGKASSGKKGKNGGKKGEKNKKQNGEKIGNKHGGDGKDGGGNGMGGGGKGKKGGEDFDGALKMEGKQHGFNEMSGKIKGGGGGGGGGRNMDFMGQMGSFPAVQGMPAMNGGGGRPQGMMGQGNPYNNPQYMAHMNMMMMNQQRENGHGGAYNPMMPYARPHPAAMGYGPPPHQMGGYGPPQQMGGYGPPPPGNDQFTHMFNDENTDSCSVM